MIPLCREEKIAVTPYSPLASGRLARDWSETTTRLETDQVAKSKYGATARLISMTYLEEPYVSHPLVGLIPYGG